MKNSEYWKLRFAQLEEAQNKLAENGCKEIERQYRQAVKEIEGKIDTWYRRLAANNGVSMAEARKMLSASELKELKWDVHDYIKYGEENALNGKWIKQLENASAKFHISKYEALKIQTQQSLESLFAKQAGITSAIMKEVYQSGYYHTAFEVQKGFGIGWDISGLDQSQIEKVIAKPWAVDGKNFSERIWSNKEKLISEVHNDLTQNIMLGADPQKAIDSIAKKMNTSKYNAGRLVMTEEAYFSSAAQKDSFNELGVEEYEVLATLDSHTSEICQSLDGKHFPMSEYKAGVTAPPFHVFCRSTTCPYFKDNFGEVGERAARGEDGKTYYVPADMSYEEWEKTFVEGGDKSRFTAIDKSSKSGIINAGSDNATMNLVVEKEQEYGVPYGQDAVNADLDYINSDKFAKKFQNITDNAAVNKSLLECSRAAIEHRNGTLFEDMYLINGNTGEILGSQLEMKIEQGIMHNESMKSALFKASAKDIPVVALHSHPEGYPPSVDDFNSAFEHNYLLGVVIGHNGQVYVYNNPNKVILDADNIQSDISFAYRGGADIDRAYQRAFKPYGLHYVIVKE